MRARKNLFAVPVTALSAKLTFLHKRAACHDEKHSRQKHKKKSRGKVYLRFLQPEEIN